MYDSGYENFSDFLEKHQSEGKASLRKAQFNNALAGNATMQIWLGKQFLGQRDLKEIQTPPDGSITIEGEVLAKQEIDIDDLSKEQLEALLVVQEALGNTDDEG